MTTDQLLDILKAYQTFETNGNGSEIDFAKWLYEKNFKTKNGPNVNLEVERKIAYLLQRVGRLGRYFGKRSFVGLDINSVEEFTILNTIYNNPNISKNSLYQQCVIELSTGTQIVKRFIDKKFVTESASKDDKRVTLIKVTNTGKDIRNKAFEALAAEVVFKNSALTKIEKDNLLTYLQKIDTHLTVKFLEEN